MKTLIVSLAALAAVSSAALAEVGDHPRDIGNYSTKMEGSATDSNTFAVVKAGQKKLTTFERMNLIAGEDRGDKGRESRNSPEM